MKSRSRTELIRSPKDRIIFALDVHEWKEAEHWVSLLGGEVGFFKVGKELFTRFGPNIIERILTLGGRVFLDLKFHDIPNTVKRAAEVATGMGISLFTCHTMGGREMMRQTVESVRSVAQKSGLSPPAVVGVTVLTSLDQRDLSDLGIQGEIEEVVLRLAEMAQQAGLDGVVASAREARAIRKQCGEDFLIITPGIRLGEHRKDDQKRVATPLAVRQAGADLLVIGRPLREAENPVAVARKISEEID